MQDIHGFLGGGRPMYSDRRMRAAAAHHHQQALNCPRCDSLNTKFCYYNNYNLSQPRHFCKNCRRYWTKGGVLRNVPVGGGCRKSKRASKRKNTSSPPPPRANKSNSGSTSGESTSAKTTARAHSSGDTVGCRNATGVAVIVSKAGSDRPPVTFNGVATPSAVPCDVMNVNFEAMRDQQGVAGFETGDSGAGLFTDIGGLLLGGDQNQSLLSVSSGGLSPFRMHQQNLVNHLTSEDHWGPEMLDQTVHVNLAGADWHSNGGTHLGFYGPTSGGNGRWSQSSNHCNVGSDNCHLYFPP